MSNYEISIIGLLVVNLFTLLSLTGSNKQIHSLQRCA